MEIRYVDTTPSQALWINFNNKDRPTKIYYNKEECKRKNDEKTQFSNEKTQLTNRKLNSDKDWELIYFKEKLIEQIDNAFRSKTINQIEQLFNRYRYDYSFNRRNIAEMFCISENGASGFIKKCLEKTLLKKKK